MKQKNIVVLGSTGSIGINTLDVVGRFSRQFKVVGLSAFNNVALLEQQVKKFRPKVVAVGKEGMGCLLSKGFGRQTRVIDALRGTSILAAWPGVDIVVLAIRGAAALRPFLAAVRCGKTVATANKEALVIAGHIITAQAKKYNARIIPIDSEQSAIFQCLLGQERSELKKIYLTASGGPLHTVPLRRFGSLTVKDILRHPRWKMGEKITVDSATLMNKGLEVMEARWLFDVPVPQIEILVHREAIIHSMVEFCDGSILAQLGITDMRLPIQYALTHPDRISTKLPPLDFVKLGQLTFDRPDVRKFPALALALDVAQKGGSLPCVLNAANEEAVDAFLAGRLKFTKIVHIVEKVIGQHRRVENPSLEKIFEIERWAREQAQRQIKG